MIAKMRPTRRRFLQSLVPGAAAISLAGCDALSRSPTFREILFSAEKLTHTAQNAVLGEQTLAQEFTEADISPAFRANGTTQPDDANYLALAEKNFVDWRLEVGGLVEKPASYSLADLRAMPSRTQITRHDCVEGWSCIGKWKGVQLSHVLNQVQLKPNARYLVFTCADELEKTLDGTGRYYESHDLINSFHPQTILAYDMNGAPLTVPHGAPLRLRVERQLGYKMAKYVMKIEAVESFESYGRGRGGFWPDRGYDWYAGI